MFSGLFFEKPLFHPFAFKKFPGLRTFSLSGQNVAMMSLGGEAREALQHQFLFAPRAG
jgi:hypothetical protein